MPVPIAPHPADRDARILENVGFVKALARRYGDRGEPLDDVIQAGMVGLVNAANRFDDGVGADFRAFAAPTILGEIRRHFRDRTWTVRVPRRVKDDSVAVSASVERLSSTLGHTPSAAEVAEDAGLTVDRVLDALAARSAYRPDSLSRATWNEEDEQERDVPAIDEGFDLAVDRIVLRQVLHALPARERVILHMRFEEGMLQSQIGERLGISQMHVSRLLARALETLRAAATGGAGG